MKWTVLGLLDRQSVHIGPQTHRALRFADPQPADDTRLADAAIDLAAEVGELLGHQIGGAPLLEPEFGVGMNVAPPARQVVVNLRDAVNDLHNGSSDGFSLPGRLPATVSATNR